MEMPSLVSLFSIFDSSTQTSHKNKNKKNTLNALDNSQIINSSLFFPTGYSHTLTLHIFFFNNQSYLKRLKINQVIY